MTNPPEVDRIRKHLVIVKDIINTLWSIVGLALAFSISNQAYTHYLWCAWGSGLVILCGYATFAMNEASSTLVNVLSKVVEHGEKESMNNNVGAKNSKHGTESMIRYKRLLFVWKGIKLVTAGVAGPSVIVIGSLFLFPVTAIFRVYLLYIILLFSALPQMPIIYLLKLSD